MGSINETAAEKGDTMDNMFLTFNVGEERFGIEIRHVLQIIGMQQITRMPDMPPEMQGFINLRGDVIPVTSLRLRFGYGDEGNYGERTCIIVVQYKTEEGYEKNVGLIVDLINETLTIDPENIAAPPINSQLGGDRYITGIARLGKTQNAVLLDVQKLLVS